jgi:glycyl-tRNA synthetase alpha chain
MSGPITFQALIQRLNAYWAEQGCVLIQPLDLEVGAGTSTRPTFLRALGPEPWNAPSCSRAAARGRSLRREPEPPAALLPVPGGDEAEPGEHPGALLGSLVALGLDPLVH